MQNLEKSLRAGVAERLIVWTLTTDKIVQTVRKVLENPSYRTKMREKSALFRDQPEKPLERALWWIDWCLRHPEAETIQSPTLRLGLWKSELYDVKIFVILAAVAVFLGVKRVFSVLTGTNKSHIKHKKKVN